MTKYILTMEHRFEVETDDIKTLLETYEFPAFNEGIIGDPEFLDGKTTYEEVSNA